MRELAAFAASAFQSKAHSMLRFLDDAAADGRCTEDLRVFTRLLGECVSSQVKAHDAELARAARLGRAADHMVEISRRHLTDLCGKHEEYVQVVTGALREEFPAQLVLSVRARIREQIPSCAIVLYARSEYMYEVLAIREFRENYLEKYADYLAENEVKVAEDPEWIVFLPVPRGEKDNYFMHGLLLGHEVAHIQVAVKGLGDRVLAAARVTGEELETVAADLYGGADGDAEHRRSLARVWLGDVTRAWIEELLADTIAVRLLGPAHGLAALEFMLASSPSPAMFTETHPPWPIRFDLTMEHLSQDPASGFQSERVRNLLEQTARFLRPRLDLRPAHEVAVKCAERLRHEIIAAGRDAVPAAIAFDSDSLQGHVQSLTAGYPPDQRLDLVERVARPPLPGEILTAGWVVALDHAKEFNLLIGDDSPDGLTPAAAERLTALIGKALEAGEVFRLWRELRDTEHAGGPEA